MGILFYKTKLSNFQGVFWKVNGDDTQSVSYTTDFCFEMSEWVSRIKVDKLTVTLPVSSLLSTILTLASKKLTEDLNFSCVNFRLR